MVQQARRVDVTSFAQICDHRGNAPLDLPALYMMHFDLVWRNLRRLGVEAASLDDAVQDVFLVVHRRAHEFLGQSSTKTWIIGIVLRVAHDYRRRQSRHSARLACLATNGSHQNELDCPSEQLALRQAAELVRKILLGFDDQVRNVFALVELEEMSLREVAEATGLSLSTCQRRLHAARKAFNLALVRHAAATRKGIDL